MSSRKFVPASTAVPDPEVQPKPERRQFLAAEKLRILEEADRCTEPGQIGALLRREGISSSHLSKWRWLRKQGQLQALTLQHRGPKTTHTPEHDEIARLKRHVARLEAKLAHAEAIIDIQKKSRRCWGCHPPSSEPRRGGRRASNGEHGGAVSRPSYPPQCRLSTAAAPAAPSTTAPSPRALSAVEQARVRATLNSPRFQDQAPRQVYATLLDEGTYLCSWSTMYRILRTHDEVRDRRN